MDDFRLRLQRRFQRQQEFAAASSPLYSCLFGLIAQWLSSPPGADPLADWLLAVSRGRASFEVPLLLMAGLHRDVLADEAAVRGLAVYYPSVGGRQAPDEKKLGSLLRDSMQKRQHALADFIASARVQTNEAARGLCWLLPALCTNWDAVHLAELGAAAGLNLAANEHQYRLYANLKTNQSTHAAGADLPLYCFGKKGHGRFSVYCEGDMPRFDKLEVPPRILSRTGCDLAPYPLQSTFDEQTLAAFVWADQVGRLYGLHKGVEALHKLEKDDAPIRLFPACLPADLESFLCERLPVCNDAPLILFNTYLTSYLSDKGLSLRPRLAQWMSRRKHPLLWLQWETAWEAKKEGVSPPEFGQLAWTADLWNKGEHHHWHLAWVHPHGTALHWLPGMHAWLKFWRG